MFVIGLGTAAPAQCYAQRECWDAVQRAEPFKRLAPRSRAILKKVLCGDNGIATRHLALDSLTEVFQLTPDVLQARFTKHAPALATEAAQRALQDAGAPPKLTPCSSAPAPAICVRAYQLCQRTARPARGRLHTGFGRAGLRRRLAICAAEALLAAKRAQKVLSVCVEVCSAAFYLDDDPGVLISACLFGDGAGAAVLTRKPRPNQRRVEWKFGSSCLAPEKRDTLRFGHKNGMLRNMLSLQVPQIAGDEAAKLFPNRWPRQKSNANVSPAGFCTPAGATCCWRCATSWD